MKSIAAFAIFGMASAIPSGKDVAMRAKFTAYLQEHNKVYTQDELSHRLSVFTENINTIDEHNKRASMGEFTFTMGIGPFTDMTHDEWVEMMSFSAIPSIQERNDVCSPLRIVELG